MPKINLKAYYPFYTSDCWIDVPQEVEDTLKAAKRAEVAQQVKIYRHRAYYSIHLYGGTIESDALFAVLRPDEICEQRTVNRHIYTALKQLPAKQARRIYAHFFLDMRYVDIARLDGVNESVIRKSINRGLKALRKKLKDFGD